MPIIEGTYKLKKNENLTSILSAQGLGMMGRNMINKQDMTYSVTYDEAAKKITQTNIVKETNVTEFIVDGPAVETEAAGGRGTLLDSVKLSDHGYILTREEKSGKYVAVNEFVFDEGKMTISMTTTPKGGKPVLGKRYFEKV